MNKSTGNKANLLGCGGRGGGSPAIILRKPIHNLVRVGPNKVFIVGVMEQDLRCDTGRRLEEQVTVNVNGSIFGTPLPIREITNFMPWRAAE